jgi:hypothetical protein
VLGLPEWLVRLGTLFMRILQQAPREPYISTIFGNGRSTAQRGQRPAPTTSPLARKSAGSHAND